MELFSLMTVFRSGIIDILLCRFRDPYGWNYGSQRVKTGKGPVLEDSYASFSKYPNISIQYVICNVRPNGMCLYISSSQYTANEGPVRIQHKCLLPIKVFLDMKLCGLVISKTELWCSVAQFPHSCTCEGFVNSQIHECRHWEQGRAVSFLGTQKSDFCYSV